MGKIWLKIWIWIKMIVFGLLALYVLAFIYENYGSPANFWYWRGVPSQTSTLKLAFFAFIAGVIATILVRTTLNTLTQIRDVQSRNRQERLQRDVEDMKAKAAMLQARAPDDRMAGT